MNSEEAQIPESNLSAADAQTPQKQEPESVNPTELKLDINDSESVDTWLEELETNQASNTNAQVIDTTPELSLDSDASLSVATSTEIEDLKTQVQQLQQQKETLSAEITTLQERKQQILDQQLKEIQETLSRMVEQGMEELQERKSNLQREIDKLERRQERIRQEMRSNFAGASQDLAIRVQGFKDYLVGSLQDLAAAAEQLQLPNLEAKTPPQKRPAQEETRPRRSSNQPQFIEQGFVEQAQGIRQLIDQYRTRPDYYGPPWQLRRTFEPIHGERVQDWFFNQGGKGAIKSMGSRLQNILVASAIISILYRLYGDRSRVLILVDTPERLGEWRRGLQDCLGISRSDFGANRGIVLFESPEILIQRAERQVQDKLLPLVIIDETEELVNLSLLRFPLWLAFASEPQPSSSGYLY